MKRERHTHIHDQQKTRRQKKEKKNKLTVPKKKRKKNGDDVYNENRVYLFFLVVSFFLGVRDKVHSIKKKANPLVHRCRIYVCVCVCVCGIIMQYNKSPEL